MDVTHTHLRRTTAITVLAGIFLLSANLAAQQTIDQNNEDRSRRTNQQDSQQQDSQLQNYPNSREDPGRQSDPYARQDRGRRQDASRQQDRNRRQDANRQQNPGRLQDSDLRQDSSRRRDDLREVPDGRQDFNSQQGLNVQQDRFDRNNRRSNTLSQQEGQQFNRNAQGRAVEDLGVTFRSNGQDRLTVSTTTNRGLLARAGLVQGDVLLAIDGRSIASQADLRRFIRDSRKSRIPLTVLRNGQRREIYIQLSESNITGSEREFYPDHWSMQYDDESGWLGVSLDTRYLRYAVVDAVQVGSAADEAGLRAGDWILSVNGQRVQSMPDLSRIIRNMDSGTNVELEVSRRVVKTMNAQLGERPDRRGRYRYEQEESLSSDGTSDQQMNRIQQRLYRGTDQSDRSYDDGGNRLGDQGQDRNSDRDDPVTRRRQRTPEN